MKRSLTLCAIALVAIAAQTASAQVSAQLNLRYNHPNDPSQGGTYELLAGSAGAGLAGISVLFDGINNDAAAAGSTGYGVFESDDFGTSVVEIVAGHDEAGLTGGATDIGLGDGTTGNQVDDLFGPGSSPAEFLNNALLASGTFGGSRPAFMATSDTRASGANDLTGGVATEAALTVSVRGDSVGTDGLLLGDTDRNGNVSLGLDIIAILGNLGQSGGWDDGDFDASGDVSLGLDIIPVLGNLGMSSTAPAVAAASVPEPGSLALAGAALAFIAGGRRRR